MPYALLDLIWIYLFSSHLAALQFCIEDTVKKDKIIQFYTKLVLSWLRLIKLKYLKTMLEKSVEVYYFMFDFNKYITFLLSVILTTKTPFEWEYLILYRVFSGSLMYNISADFSNSSQFGMKVIVVTYYKIYYLTEQSVHFLRKKQNQARIFYRSFKMLWFVNLSFVNVTVKSCHVHMELGMSQGIRLFIYF